MDGSLAVTKNLHLDVTGLLDDLFNVETAIAEGRLGLGAGLRHQGFKFVHVMWQCECRGHHRRRQP